MKVSLTCISLLIALLVAGHALDIVTPEGTLKDVQVKKVVGDAVSVTHSDGTALVDMDLLPPALQLEYGWTPEKSAARKAAKEAEEKRIAEEEKMIEEAPKRKAMAEEARKKAEEEKLLAEEKAMRRKENAAFEAESSNAQSDLIAAAAKARAELDRERKGGKGAADSMPVATILGDGVKETAEPPGPKARIVTPGIGTVSDAIITENPLLKNYKLMIGVIVGLLVVAILFMLPSGTPKKVRRR